jgi:hypothetical protein
MSIYIIFLYTSVLRCVCFMLCGENTPSQRLRQVCTCTSVCPDACKVQYTVNSHEKRTLTEAMKARQKGRVAGPSTGCRTNQATCLEEKQRVRQTAVRYTQKSKQTNICAYIHIHTSMHVCMHDCLRSESQSASHSSPPQLKGVQVISACARACLC